MKVMLINPISELARVSDAYYHSVSPLPPLGLAYLASVLKKKNIDVLIEDQYATRLSNEDLVNRIKNELPQVIGLSCLTTAMSNAEKIIHEVKRVEPGIKIILGNIHPTIFQKEIFEKKLADIIVRGEGEEAFLETIEALEGGRDLDNIKGISYANNGDIRFNPDREMIEDLDTLPYPDWHSLDLENYKRYPVLGIYDKRVLPIQASRGCPYKCIFCSQDKVYQKPRYRKIKKVVDEIEYYYDEYKINCVGFNDAYFPFSKDSGLEFCDEIIRRKLHKKISWFTETRVDMVDLELVKRMKESNIRLIMFGFESGNQKILDTIGKKTTLEQARKAIEYTRKFKIRSLGLFMLGLPGDTKETCHDTIRFAKELNPDICKFNITVPYPGSELFDIFKSKLYDVDSNTDRFTSWFDWSSYNGEIIYSPEALTKKELLNLQRKGMLTFYLRPGIILKSMIKKTFSCGDILRGGTLLIKSYLKSL